MNGNHLMIVMVVMVEAVVGVGGVRGGGGGGVKEYSSKQSVLTKKIDITDISSGK